MADNVTIPATGSGTATPSVATDDVAVNGGSSAHVQYVKLVDGTANGTAGLPGDATYGLDVDVTRIIGPASVAAARASVTTTSAQFLAARATRKRVTILALTSNTDVVDIGASGVASGSGYPLAPGASIVLETTVALHADAASGTQVLATIEEYA